MLCQRNWSRASFLNCEALHWRNDRRGTAGGKAADYSALEMPLVTSARFAEWNIE
jgi:hypothetical protein